uniref:Uncharacterized protein n=1 Tax=Panagrolaimus sp. JU765 TaxID=591449 RepID=A0AC34R0W0_9BILA
MPDYVDVYTPEYTTCCLLWHVRKAASFIGYLSLVLAIIGLRCVWVLLKYVTYTPAYIAINIITIPFVIIVFIFILYQSNDSANGMDSIAESSTQFPIFSKTKFDDPWSNFVQMYKSKQLSTPFPIFSNSNYNSFSSIVETQKENNDLLRNVSRNEFISYIILFIYVGIIKVYFWIIVMKAKKYMEKEICTGNVRRQEFIVQMQPIVVEEQ